MRNVLFGNLIAVSFISSSFASQTVVTCEERSFEVYNSSMKYTVYPVLSSTILIDRERKVLTHMKVKNGSKFEAVFNIIDEDNPTLIAVEEFKSHELSVIHYSTEKNQFNKFWSKEDGSKEIANTVTMGRCF